MAIRFVCPDCESPNIILVESAMVYYTGGFKPVAGPTGLHPEWDEDNEGTPQIDWDSSIFECYDCDACHSSFKAPKMLEVE